MQAVNAITSQAGAPQTVADVFVALLDETRTVAAGCTRGDLVARLDATRELVLDPRRRIVVVGPLKQGKSSFVNALLGLEVCSVGDDETTAVTTFVQYGPENRAEVVTTQGRVRIPFDSILAVGPRLESGDADVLRLEISVPSPLLREGVVLVDTPGVGGHGNPHAASVLGVVAAADAVFVLSDAGTELTEPEVGFLRQVTGLCSAVACLVTKTDLYPSWRQVLAANGGHLARAGVDVPLLPVSSLLRGHAVRLQDRELAAESGFGPLFDFLRSKVVARADAAVRAAVGNDVRSATEHLALSLGSELAALRDPAAATAAVAELTKAKSTAEDLQRKTALWQQTLGDGITDLAADIDHDLRDRLRRITRDAELWIDDNDPGVHWEQLTEWLTTEVGSAIGDNFVWAHERAEWLAKRVADHFSEVVVELPHLDLGDLDSVLDPVESLGDLDDGRIGLGQKVLVGMRGSYGGVLMFGLITTVAGLALINPISLGAGVLLGTKAYREDKEARVQRRRGEAKIAVRRFAEDVSFQANKESKDRLRQIQRVLRDHFTAIAEQTLRSINESLRAAQEAANVTAASRAQRAAALEHQLRAIAALRARADRIAPAVGPAARDSDVAVQSDSGAAPAGHHSSGSVAAQSISASSGETTES